MANNVAYTSGKLIVHTDYPALHFAPGVSQGARDELRQSSAVSFRVKGCTCAAVGAVSALHRSGCGGRGEPDRGWFPHGRAAEERRPRGLQDPHIHPRGLHRHREGLLRLHAAVQEMHHRVRGRSCAYIYCLCVFRIWDATLPSVVQFNDVQLPPAGVYFTLNLASFPCEQHRFRRPSDKYKLQQRHQRLRAGPALTSGPALLQSSEEIRGHHDPTREHGHLQDGARWAWTHAPSLWWRHPPKSHDPPLVSAASGDSDLWWRYVVNRVVC